MIGKVCVSKAKYYDATTKKLKFKTRPVLIIGQADTSDYVALPISRITNHKNTDPTYDYPLEKATYPLLNLHDKSYIRTHKQFIVNSGEITQIICDFKLCYQNSYSSIISLVDQFQHNLIGRAL